MATPTLQTSIGDFLLHEYRLPLGDRVWSFLHTGTTVTVEQEQTYLTHDGARLPYGAMLWPSSIALAHDVFARAEQLARARVLELGAGTGLPGIVAASLGARVVQVDRSEVALHLCRMNAERNATTGIDLRCAEWATLQSDTPFDFIIGADVLYATAQHDQLRAICDAYLAPGGTVLFADPLRTASLPMLEAMERSGYRVSLTKWSIGVDSGTRTIAIYEASHH
ncbi:MAG: methyltransferase domain-containing protein [Polyangiales bacterium]